MSFTWSPLELGAPLVLADDAEPQPSAPGSTLTALQAGGGTWKWVAAIYGYPYLISDAPPVAVLTAWAGAGDWNDALGGLYVELENEQRLNPWAAFQEGGTLTLRIAPDADDTFGIDTHRATAGADTVLTATIGADPTDTTVEVKSTASFDSTGTIHLGNETVLYASKDSNSFNSCTRGVYAPFSVDVDHPSRVAGRFSQRHEVATDANAIKLQPVVSEHPRPPTWIGKWVGLWLHRWDEENQLLNTRANAQLVFAGRVVAVGDDPSTATTAVEVEHVLDYIKNASIGPDWSAKIKEGIFLRDGMLFSIEDSGDDGTTWSSATDLEVVPSAATAPYQINEGIYELNDLVSALNDWWAAALGDGDISGYYRLAIEQTGPGGASRAALNFRIAGAGPEVFFTFIYPESVSKFLGKLHEHVGPDGAVLTEGPSREDDVNYEMVSARAPLRTMLSTADFDDLPLFEVVDEQGTFVDQTGDLPTDFIASGGGELGLIMVDNRAIFGAAKIGDQMTAGVAISRIRLVDQQRGAGLYDILGEQELTVDDQTPPTTVRQVLFYQDSFAEVLKAILYTVNGEGVNHATYDSLARQLGIGIPGELLGNNFEDSCDTLPGADADCILALDKATKFVDIVGGSLVFRWTFLRWINEHLEFCNWKSPTTGNALTESNKASPVGTEDDQRSASELSSEWQRSLVKVQYDRNLESLDFDGGFRSETRFVDPAAIDDAGGAVRPQTLQLRDVYGTDGIELLESQFKGTAPLFTRPVRIMRRTIDSRFFEGYSVGDCVIVTDAFARDPDTGQRGVSARPGIITRHQWSLGGAGPNGSVGDAGGEVDIMFLDLLRVAPYVPTAMLDQTSTNSGYVVATKIATCHANKFSEATDAADASYFTTGRKIRLIEADPSNPAAPSTHDDTVASQTGNTITLTDGFAGFDNTKRYLVVFDTYSDSIAAQQSAFVYQADDADGMISDARAPFQYTTPPVSLGTANSASDELWLPADNTFGDGIGLDVGTEVACNRLAINAEDYGHAIAAPYLDVTEMSGATATGTWLMVEMRPIWLTAEQDGLFVTRTLKVSPYVKSSDGASASVRVSLTRYPVVDDTLNDATLGLLVSSATFTVTSTTYAVPTAQNLTISGIKSANSGVAYLVIECTVKARTKGLAICQESARTA